MPPEWLRRVRLDLKPPAPVPIEALTLALESSPPRLERCSAGDNPNLHRGRRSRDAVALKSRRQGERHARVPGHLHPPVPDLDGHLTMQIDPNSREWPISDFS